MVFFFLFLCSPSIYFPHAKRNGNNKHFTVIDYKGILCCSCSICINRIRQIAQRYIRMEGLALGFLMRWTRKCTKALAVLPLQSQPTHQYYQAQVEKGYIDKLKQLPIWKGQFFFSSSHSFRSLHGCCINAHNHCTLILWTSRDR